MPLPSFTDSNVKSYINGLSLLDLKTFSLDLQNDFDTTITSRFTLSPNQAMSMIQTPNFVKQSIANAMINYSNVREAGIAGNFEIIGLDPSGSGSAPMGVKIDIKIEYNPHTGQWKVEIIIEITKAQS